MSAPYQRAVYDNSAATQRMSDLIARRGAINADLYLRQGDAAANTAQAIGSGVGQFMSDLLRYKADEPRRELLKQETEARKADLADRQAARGAKTPIAQLLLDPSMRTAGQFNVPQYDMAKLESAVKASPEMAPFWESVQEQAQKRDALELDRFKTQRALDGIKRRDLAMAAYEVLASGLDPDVLSSKVEELVGNGTIRRDEAAQYLAKASSPDGGGMEGLVSQLIRLDPSVLPKTEYQKLGQGESLVRVPAGGGAAAVVAQGQPKQEPLSDRERYIERVTGKKIDQVTDAEYRAATRGFRDDTTRPPSAMTTGGAGPDTAATIADAIVKGEQPPDLKGLYRYGAAVRAELAKRGYDFSKASQDWTATQRFLSTANGPQITRLRQATQFAYDSLDVVESLANEWDGGQFGPLNRARLTLAKQGALGQQAQSIATRLDAQVNDLVSELGTVYKGGNSSTDESLRLAAGNLQTDWSKQTLVDNVNLVRKNLQIRLNSLRSTGPVTSGDNQYYTAPPLVPAHENAKTGPTTVTAPNGKTYTFGSQEQAEAFKQAAGIK